MVRLSVVHFYLLMSLLIASCTTSEDGDQKLFVNLPAAITNITFENTLTPTEEFNMYIFRNFYNGGGVAVGDVSGNGLPDIFLTGNMTSNRLYLNKGNFEFEDITDAAGLRSDDYWTTGASLADINGNGFLDIFITLSGPPEGENRQNKLYINNGDLTFSDRSKEYGLDDIGLSTHAVFFDFNGSGLLDMYLVSNSFSPIKSFAGITADERLIPDPEGASKLYRNDGGSFTDVTDEAGIYSSRIGFGLSATVADINRNGLPDLYVANDFFERDYLYINNGDGTFTESLDEKIHSLSFSSMGSDIADLNNNGWPEIYVSDMLPIEESRLKSKMTIESWDEYSDNVEKGFHHKFTRNTLQVNRGDGSFSETGRFSDAYSTDWSWAVLIADYDLNGNNDIFVANGIYKDLLDQDYIEQVANPRVIREMMETEGDVILQLMDGMSSHPIPNVAFGNDGDLRFSDRTADWGLDEPGFSSGAAWADLNGDGSLDLVVNNTNGPARIYRNRAGELYPQRTWLRVDLLGEAPNTYGIGAQLQVWSGEELRYREHYLQRGFQSSVEPGLFVGMGEAATADSLVLRWPDGRTSRVQNLDLPARITLSQSDAEDRPAPPPLPAMMPGDLLKRGDLQESNVSETWQSPQSGLETDGTDAERIPNDAGTLSGQQAGNLQASAAERGSWQRRDTELENEDSGRVAKERTLPGLLEPAELLPITGRKHQRYEYNDFNRERLLMRMRSTEGPALCTGDVTGNGLDDVYLGGARGQAGALYLQDQAGEFAASQAPLFEADEAGEDIGCALFDATGNGVSDLYVASGGNSYGSGSSALSDRFYLNDGEGRFSKTDQVLPTRRGFESSSVVAPHDFTGDGNMDLFVGIRLRPFGVGLPVNGYLLAGDGQGGFSDVTAQWAPELLEAGMITDGLWADLTGDGANELVITGEWMPIRVFANSGVSFEEITESLGLSRTHGWWNALAAADVNGNGRLDIIAGNHGENSMFRASEEHPVRMWVGDFARNGMVEQILATQKQGSYYPVALRHDLIAEIPRLGETYPDYASYAGQTVQEIFTGEELSRAHELQAEELRSMIYWNEGESEFRGEPLPVRAQLSPMYGIHSEDLTGNGRAEIVMGGNLYHVKPQSGPYDASRGVVLGYDEQAGLFSYHPDQSGVNIPGEIRAIKPVRAADGHKLIIARYNDVPVIVKIED